ncbi:ABC transporter substrate-binding protein [Methanoregula sp.]|uniref:ABC transporter substrate-binding protein n=1 Tax=Methanoregula sp. TaxID=2052170 RepID=UPI002C433F4A|nr:ABC transporter substrate-binding protein [Methanoregula sp.]HVP96700.1 ABC transporter substrate-binding protein [Methanoregula sp.]
MKFMKLTAIAFVTLALVLVLLSAGCTQPAGTSSGSAAVPSANGTVGILETAGVGPMPSLLATGQVDGYIAWQPVVEAGVESNIGHVAVYSKDLPPAGEWSDHPQNVFVVRKDFYAQNPDFVNDFSALNLAATQYINDHPQETAAIDADWLAGGQNFTYGNVSVSSVTAVNNSIPTIEFSNNPSDSWKASTSDFVQALINLGTVRGFVANSTNQDTVLYNFQPFTSATAIISSKNVITPAPMQNTVGVGYLMAVDHSALFVAVKDWQYFNDTYGIALKPEDLTKAKPDVADFIVNGQKVATVNLVPANAGPNLMQLAATNSIQMSYVGVPPAISAIDQGIPITIAYPIDNLGSGLVVANGAPVQDWQSFAAWAKARSDAGKPLVIAAPGKGSIQDVMIRSALQNSGITVTEVKV